MGQFDYQRTVIAYHGCDESIVNEVLLNGAKLKPSEKVHDWLGRGSYFWEHGPKRALAWAGDPERKIKKPAVLGAVMHLGNCFDLLDTQFTSILAGAFPEFCRVQRENGRPMPENKGRRHNLDCAVINWTIEYLESKHGQTYHTVRGMFQEGNPAFATSEIKTKSHIQIAVRHPEVVLGYFKPVIDNSANLGFASTT
jgi:hypothetical protein